MKKFGRVAFAAAVFVGCGDSASIGDAPCATEGVQCQELELDLPPMLQEVRTGNVPSLTPRWTKSSELGLDAVVSRSTLARASAGGLWLFESTPELLIAKRLDADGKLLGEQRIVPPPGLDKEPGWDALHGVWGVSDHPLGPVVVVDWMTRCPAELSAVDIPTVCPRSEILVFGDDLASEVHRIDGSPMQQRGNTLYTAYRSARGDAVIVPLLPYEIRAIDLRGNELWTADLQQELGNDWLMESSTTFPAGALDPDGALVLPLFDFIHGDSVHYPIPNLLLRQPRDGGEPTLERYISADAQRPDYSEVKQGSTSAVAFDAQGRRLLLNHLENGDLLVLRLAGAETDGFRVLREDYRDLGMSLPVVDPAGTMHIAVSAGGRDASLLKSLLCSFPMQGSAGCAQLPAAVEHLESPAPGVIFALTKDGLMRFDL